MEPQSDWEKRSAAEIEAENRKSTFNIFSSFNRYSVWGWLLHVIGILLALIGHNFMYLIVGVGFGAVISALGRIVSAIDKQYNIR